MNPELPGVNMYITTCLHGVDLRFTPRCYLCKPWPDDSPVWKVTSPGHVHEGEWCALCVEAGGEARELSEAHAPLDVERLARALWRARKWVAPEWVEEGVSRPDYATTAEMAAAIAREYAALEEPTDE